MEGISFVSSGGSVGKWRRPWINNLAKLKHTSRGLGTSGRGYFGKRLQRALFVNNGHFVLDLGDLVRRWAL
jgi:hypothetical protein